MIAARTPVPRRRMRGAALLIGLLLLAALTGLGAAAGAGAVLQARMADNFHHRANARGAVATATHAAERWLFGVASDTPPAPCQAPCGAGGALLEEADLPVAIESADAAWWRAHAVPAGTDPVSGEILVPWRPAGTEPAHWLIAQAAVETVATGAGPVAVGYYRLLARGSGPGGRGATVTETVLARPWGLAPEPPLEAPVTARAFCRGLPAPAPCGRLAWRELR